MARDVGGENVVEGEAVEFLEADAARGKLNFYTIQLVAHEFPNQLDTDLAARAEEPPGVGRGENVGDAQDVPAATRRFPGVEFLRGCLAKEVLLKIHPAPPLKS